MTRPPTVDPAVQALVGDLEQNFRKQVQRALGVDLDGSVVSLAFVDHYLGLAREETRAPILALLSAGAGAYFGELVRREFGGTWVGRADEPRGLQLLLGAEFLFFSPIAVAQAAVLGREPDDEDLDCALHLDVRPNPGTDPTDDAAWISQRLESAAPVPVDQFFTLTTRFETIAFIVELLAERRAAAGNEPRTYTVDDYLHVLS